MLTPPAAMYASMESGDGDDQMYRRPPRLLRFQSQVSQASRRLARYCRPGQIKIQTMISIVLLIIMICVLAWHLLPTNNRLAGIRGPYSREEIGHGTWALLHTMAAKFPANATSTQQNDYVQFVQILSRLFPCEECSEHFQVLLKRNPPVVSDGDSFRSWLCRAHNIVNGRLGLPNYDCSRLEDEWQPMLKGEVDCGCSLGHIPADSRQTSV